ncbi:uncharacterized protein LOC128549893 [Mercenaria mercenaria]|uniref:uncharacterized protein LOC128549893 n=1 Tax=Mercenaria mercenaria TaxID=6596 RepID=UPI00234F96CD|nr:uncharacterized protein LOC128549893 [Mercenaria mercenaria]
MATNGSTTDASDELFDFICSPCNKKDKNSEAMKYCVDCQEYLCVPCVESHNSFSVLTGHTLVERSKFGNASRTDSKELPSVPTERCKVHSLKLVDMYCADHDSVGCHVCFTLNHKPCVNIHYIPDFVRTIPQAEDARKIKNEIEKATTKTETLLKQKQRTRDENTKRRAICCNKIKTYRAEIDQTLDRLEQTAVAEVDRICNTEEKNIQAELKNLQETTIKLNQSKAALESSQKNQSQQFVSRKTCEKLLSETETTWSSSDDKRGDATLFTKNLEIHYSLQQFKSLGCQSHQEKLGLYQVQSKKDYSVKLKDDGNSCDIWSSCMLDSGDMLLVDNRNSKIKLVECETYTVRNSLTMTEKPRSVCKVSSEEVAVSLNNRIQFVSTVAQLRPTRTLMMDHNCRGIAVTDEKIVVCEQGKRVFVHTMDGTCLRTISSDRSGQVMFTCAREVSLGGGDGKMIHVTGYNQDLVTIDIDGNAIWKYSSNILKSGWGVCTDENGNVLVSGDESNNVVQLNSDGKCLGEVVSKSHALKNPRAICFDIKQSKLIVAAKDNIHVFLIR